MQWWTLSQLKSSKAHTRASAAQKLGRNGSTAALEHLANASNDTEAEVRKSAAEALGKIGSEEAFPILRTRIYDPEPTVRLAVVKAIQELNSPQGIPLLVSALGDPSGEVAWQAAQALSAAGWQPENESDIAAWHLAVGEFDKAIGYGSAAIEPLSKVTRNLAFHCCIRAVECLAQIDDPQVVDPLLEALASGDSTVRSAAAAALGQVGDARAVDPLVDALKDQSHQVCLSACVSLSKIGDQRGVEPLIEILEHRESEVRAGALETLGRLRDRRAVAPVIGLLQDDDPHVRESAANALGALRDGSAIEHLVVALIDAESAVRQAAARALAMVEPQWERCECAHRAIPALQAALKSKEYWVRYSSADVLNKLGQAQMQDTLPVADTDGARQKRQAVAGILISMLGDRDRDFRLAAAEALGRLGVPDAISILVEHLTDADPAVKVASAHSLESLRWQPNRMGDKARQLVALERWSDIVALGEHAVEALAEASGGRSVLARRRAIETLVKIGGVKVVSALNRIAAEPDGAVREEALAGISVLKTDSSPIVHAETEPQSTGPII